MASRSNIGQKIQYSQLSIFSNCFLKYILYKRKKAPFCNNQFKKMFLHVSLFILTLNAPILGQMKIKVKFLCAPFSNTLKHFLRYGKEVGKIFDFIFHPAETFFGIWIFVKLFRILYHNTFS